MKNIKCYGIRLIFTMLLCSYSILQVYYIKIENIHISLADICMLLILPVSIIAFNFYCFKINLPTLVLLLLSGFQLLFLYTFSRLDSGTIVNTVHFILVLFVLCFFIRNIYNTKYGIKFVIIISVVSSIYLILQFILLKVFNIYISGQVDFLASRTAVTGRIRPFSFFSEPAAFGFYATYGLATCLFTNKESDKRKKWLIVIITVALLISMSTTSIGLMIVVWMLWIFDFLKNNNKIKVKYLLIVFLSFLILLILGWRLNIFKTIYEHTFEGLSSGKMANGLSGRIGNLSYAWNYHTKIASKWFGVGIVDLDYFIPAFARIYIYYGIIGYLIFGFFFAVCYKNTGKLGKVYIIITMVAALFSDSIFGAQMFTYMPIVMSEKYLNNN